MNVQNFEQQLSLYTDIKVYCGIAALVFLALAVILFFALKIPAVFAEMTGKKARQAVKQMTEENPESGMLKSSKGDELGKQKRKKESTAKLNSEKLPQKHNYMPAAPADVQPDGSNGAAGFTGTAGQSYETEETGVLGSQETVPLSSNSYETDETGVLGGQVNPPAAATYETEETSVLGNNAPPITSDTYETRKTKDLSNGSSDESTAKLSRETNTANKQESGRVPMSFVVERSIIEIHTDEVI